MDDATTPEQYARFIYGCVLECYGPADETWDPIEIASKFHYEPFVKRVAEVIRWVIAQERTNARRLAVRNRIRDAEKILWEQQKIARKRNNRA